MERTTDEEGNLHRFSIAFVRHNDGRNGQRGSIKEIKRAAKFTKPGKKVTLPKRMTSGWQFKAHEVLPIQDLTADELNTIKFTNIIEYNGQKVRHWGS